MKTKIIELHKNTTPHPKLIYEYTTNQHYQLQISYTEKTWTAKLTLKPLPERVKKEHRDELFADHVKEPRAFAATLNNEPIGWIETGYEKWNNRMRIWELLVKKEYRRKGIGTQLMKHAITIAKEKNARMLVLETHSCNVDAIRFYLAHGFQLIGFDTTAYSNQDIEKGEIRLELGLKL
jgi:ribosomal protein S18 acetylase RimI-like enzyme